MSTALIGQGNAETLPYSNVFPPNPEAASFSKYADIPVGKFTGTANVSIPLYTLKSKHLSTSVGLRYHGGGLKVSERASWVGGGWNLNATGVITRTVKGMPDDLVESFGPVARNYYSSNGQISAESLAECDNGSSDRWNDLYNISINCEDIEYDIFSYSLPNGSSGQIIFDQSNQPVFLQPTNMKLVKLWGGISNNTIAGFQLITGDGTIYQFDREEVTAIEDYCMNLPSESTVAICQAWNTYTSAWYLSKIYDPNKLDSIVFTYAIDTHRYDRPVYRLDSEVLESSSTGHGLSGPSSCISSVKVTYPRLTSIQGQAGYSIDFIANTTRDDFDGAKRLDRIEHKFNSNLLTKYNFSMGYFKDPYTQSNTMLRLDTVQQEGYDSNQDEVVPPYTFSYHGNTRPKPESLEFDHWGFYNGGGNFVVYLDSACNEYNNAHYGRREPMVVLAPVG
jgi:hypothetical protein